MVEAVGDHGCEYMTGGRVVVLGSTGRNFAAGMSGGIAYILDDAGNFSAHCNQDLCELERLTDGNEIDTVRAMIERHHQYTGSMVAEAVLEQWEDEVDRFVKVMPTDYKRVLEATDRAETAGLSGDEAVMEAFEANKSDVARVGGN